MKVLIIDDHPMLRDGLAAVLQQADPQTSVLQARDANEGLALADDNADLDLVILDLQLPGMEGVEAISEFARRRPGVRILILSSSEDPRDVRRSLAAGALGYVPKSAGQQLLLSAIRLVMNGDFYIPPLMLDEKPRADTSRAANADAVGTPVLTDRQIEILQLLSEGMPNKTIATSLKLSEKTVKVHVTAIFKTLNVVNRTQAAAAGRKAGLI